MAAKDAHEQHEEEEYLRVSEVAALFHVSPKTIARWANEGRLPHMLTLGGHRRFPRRAVERLIRELEEPRADRPE